MSRVGAVTLTGITPHLRCCICWDNGLDVDDTPSSQLVRLPCDHCTSVCICISCLQRRILEQLPVKRMRAQDLAFDISPVYTRVSVQPPPLELVTADGDTYFYNSVAAARRLAVRAVFTDSIYSPEATNGWFDGLDVDDGRRFGNTRCPTCNTDITFTYFISTANPYAPRLTVRFDPETDLFDLPIKSYYTARSIDQEVNRHLMSNWLIEFECLDCRETLTLPELASHYECHHPQSFVNCSCGQRMRFADLRSGWHTTVHDINALSGRIADCVPPTVFKRGNGELVPIHNTTLVNTHSSILHAFLARRIPRSTLKRVREDDTMVEEDDDEATTTDEEENVPQIAETIIN